jgi:transposase
MVKRQMFSKIQKLRMQGFSMEAIALELGINRKTVSNYVQMSPEEYIAYERESRSRKRIPSEYKEKIIEIYRNNGFKRLNMTGVYDYLEEIVGKLAFTDRTLRNYINSLIQNGELKISETIRMYEKVAPLPFGKQMQMDFGQYKFKSGLKVYIFATLLSASRYKYVSFQDRPFRGKDIIDHLINCFEYFGGQPEELVIDQDAALVASENHGDILYTKEFSHFIEEMNLKMYVCRKADPESKGKVENLVGYVKHNFLDIRDYSEIEELCKSGLLWLDRRANGSISAATGLIPANVITEERKFLHPIRNSIFKINSIVKDERIVSQQSFISYQNSLYSVLS